MKYQETTCIKEIKINILKKLDKSHKLRYIIKEELIVEIYIYTHKEKFKKINKHGLSTFLKKIKKIKKKYKKISISSGVEETN